MTFCLGVVMITSIILSAFMSTQWTKVFNLGSAGASFSKCSFCSLNTSVKTKCVKFYRKCFVKMSLFEHKILNFPQVGFKVGQLFSLTITSSIITPLNFRRAFQSKPAKMVENPCMTKIHLLHRIWTKNNKLWPIIFKFSKYHCVVDVQVLCFCYNWSNMLYLWLIVLRLKFKG